MNQYVQTDLEADRQVASTLAELILGGALATGEATDSAAAQESAGTAATNRPDATA